MSEVFEYFDEGSDSWVEIDVQSVREIFESGGISRGDVIVPQSVAVDLEGDERIRLRDTDGGFNIVEGFLDGGGEFDEDGNCVLKFLGLGGEIKSDDISVFLNDTDNHSAFEEVVSDTEYDVVLPSVSASSISTYTYSGVRKNAIGELNDLFGYVSVFRPKLDGSGVEVRYEPEGYVDSEEEINTGSDGNSVLKKYKRKTRRNIVKKAKVVGRDASGDLVEAIRPSVSVDAGIGEFVERQVDFVISQSEAESIAESLLNPDPVDVARIRTSLWYRTKLVNQVVVWKDDRYNIDDSFVVKKQETFWPERQSVLHLGLADDEMGVGEASREAREIREERSNVLSDVFENIGEQLVMGETDDHKHDAEDIAEHDHLKPSEISDDSDVGNDYVFNRTSFTSSGSVSVSVPFVSGGVDYVLISVHVSFGREGDQSYLGHDVFVDVDGSEIFGETDAFNIGGSGGFSLISNADSGDSVEAFIFDVNDLSQPGELTLTVQSISRHSHVVGSVDVDGNNAFVDDFDRSPGISGETAEELLELLRSFKTKRD